MKKLSLFLVLILCAVHSRAAIYLTVGFADSSMAISAIETLNQLETVDDFKLVFPDSFKTKETVLRTQFKLDQYTKAGLVFNNQFYNYLNNKSAPSAVFLINRVGRIVYQTKLQNLQTSALAYYTRYNAKKIAAERVHIKGIRGAPVVGDVSYFSYRDNNMRNYVFDFAQAQLFDLSFEEDDLAAIYKAFLGHRFAKRYPIIKNARLTLNGMLPEVTAVRKLDTAHELIIQIAAKDTIDRNNNDWLIYHRTVLARYDMHNKKFSAFYGQGDAEQLEKKQINFLGIEIVNQKLYGLYKADKKTEGALSFCQLTFDNQNNTFAQSATCLTDYIPAGFLTKTKSLYWSLYSNDGRAVVYQYADSVYDFKLKKMIPIPLQWTANNLSIEYDIIGMCYNEVTKNYHILYSVKDRGDYRLLVFDANGKRISNDEVAGGWGNLISPYQIIRYNRAQKHFQLIDL